MSAGAMRPCTSQRQGARRVDASSKEGCTIRSVRPAGAPAVSHQKPRPSSTTLGLWTASILSTRRRRLSRSVAAPAMFTKGRSKKAARTFPARDEPSTTTSGFTAAYRASL